jgi:hypothetical protein
MTLSSAVNSGSRKWNWKTKPMRLSRSAARASSSSRRGRRAVDQHLAGARQIEQTEQIEQRRLARARRPGHGEKLAAPHHRDRRRRSASSESRRRVVGAGRALRDDPARARSRRAPDDVHRLQIAPAFRAGM